MQCEIIAVSMLEVGEGVVGKDLGGQQEDPGCGVCPFSSSFLYALSFSLCSSSSPATIMQLLHMSTAEPLLGKGFLSCQILANLNS